jgi:hypothetical protein
MVRGDGCFSDSMRDGIVKDQVIGGTESNISNILRNTFKKAELIKILKLSECSSSSSGLIPA